MDCQLSEKELLEILSSSESKEDSDDSIEIIEENKLNSKSSDFEINQYDENDFKTEKVISNLKKSNENQIFRLLTQKINKKLRFESINKKLKYK